MAKGDIYLGPIDAATLLSPVGRRFSEGEIEGQRQDRTASGRLVSDVAWTKMTFTIDYADGIDGDVLDGLKTLYRLRANLSLILHYTDVSIVPFVVSMKPFKRKRDLLDGIQIWSGTSIELEEV